MNATVQGYTAAVVDGLDEAGRRTLAADVAAVERLVHTNDNLHSAMTDVSVPARARRAVLDELLAGRVGDPARRLCAYAAGAVRAQEVPGTLTWLANRLRQVTEMGGAPEELLSYSQARARVGGYAAAVFEEVDTAALEDIEDQLFRFARIVGSTPALRTALTDRDRPVDARRGIVQDLLAAKVQPATLRLATYAVVGGRPRDIVGTLDWLAEQTAVARGWRIARVRSGQDVDADERRSLEETLTRIAGSPVELQVTVDPALLAGVEVEIGDLRLDATARGRLDRLREHVMHGGWTDLGFGRAGRAAGGTAQDGGGGATDAG